MNSPLERVFLNRFRIKQLSKEDLTVCCYSPIFNPPPVSGREFSEAYKILWDIYTPGALLGKNIVTKHEIPAKYLRGKTWQLKLLRRDKVLDPKKEDEKKALERIYRCWLEEEIGKKFSEYEVDPNSPAGLTLWERDNIILQNHGWEVHPGFTIDVVFAGLNLEFLLLEIDIRHRFYTPWTLEQWLNGT